MLILKLCQASLNEQIRGPVIRNLPACLAVSFAAKDLFAFRFLATREFGFETEFIGRMALLPGSLLFWGFAGWLAAVFNISFGASLGWLVSKKYRDRK
jgi:hypothetical protein